MDTKYDVFISHSSEEAEKAEKVCCFLESNEVKCWYAPRNIKPGGNYPAQILEALRHCDVFLLLASEKTNISEHVNNEIERAFDYKKLIIPFMLQNIQFPDDQLYFLARKQRIDSYKNFERGLEYLLSTILPYIQNSRSIGENTSIASNNPKHTIVNKDALQKDTLVETIVLDGQQALELFSVDFIVENTVYIEYETMKALNQDNAENREQWIELFAAFPETLKLLLVDGKIVGFWHFVCLNDEYFEVAKSGVFSDDKLTMDAVEYLHFPGNYNGYFMSIAILPAFRSSKTFQLLMNALMEQLEKLAENDIFITKWCTNAFTNEGKAMSKSLRLQYICDNVLGGEIYFSEFITMTETSLVKRYSKLIELYKKHLQKDS